jgi:hypothetical protein
MKSKSTVCEEIVSPRYLPKHGRNERKVLNRTVCLLNLSNKFNIFIGHFVYSIYFQNTNILIVYVLFISFITSTWEGIRWGIRGLRERENGETGEGTWEGMRWTFRGITGEGKQAREMGKREHTLQLFCRNLLLFSSSAFGIAGMREEAAGLQ